MGDSGSRRSTLVSRLPIFRKSISRRHDSLPSSPSSSNTVAVHSSSPSSTNSSSGSTGKRRSIFRAPSISFHHKKGSEPKQEPTNQNLSISNGAQPGHSNMQKLSLEEHIKTRGRHSVGFSSSRNKKITRSLTENFEREKEHSTNKNVFINCLSSGKSEGDDSGFTEEQTRRSVKQSTRKLLPKSFSSHYKFSKPVPQSQSISLVQQSEFSLEITQYQEREPVFVRASPSCSVDVTERAGSSLQSPLLSADLTTAQTPSEFLALTEDSVSEADVFPNSGSMASHCDNGGHNDPTSQSSPNPAAVTKTTIELMGAVPGAVMSPGKYRLEGRCSTESNSLSETSAANQKEVSLQITELPVKNVNNSETHVPADTQREENLALQNGESMPRTGSPRKLGFYEQHKAIAERVKGIHPVSDSRIIPSSGDQHILNKTYGYEASTARVLASSLSPYREGRFIERRLRSSSEGTAGSSRMILKPKDGNVEEINSLRKQRTSSSSSKMNSMAGHWCSGVVALSPNNSALASSSEQPTGALMPSLVDQAIRHIPPLPLGSLPVFRSGRSESKQLAALLLLWQPPVALMQSLLDQATHYVPPLPSGSSPVFRSGHSESKQLATQLLLRQPPRAPVVAPSPSAVLSSHL
ncbi:Serine-rich coiled-coil domain-containing protein 1 [Sciurus carolinensis]|uniref:Serine-rich coiled-coil domain-containing protein 1 n=1 Tax=Sciurus carolinensis TaxID=30640 RepID=A0AA41ME33_SCICA|nr:Serine-rich coiled-coil domain-containing protein 1 [Sciurus carolinensis]